MNIDDIWVVYRVKTDPASGKLIFGKPIEYRIGEEAARRVGRLFDLQLTEEAKGNTSHRFQRCSSL